MSGDKENDELTDAQLDEIADRVADKYSDAIADRAASKVIANVQLEVGKSALRAISYVAGAILVAIVAWLTAHGYIKS